MSRNSIRNDLLRENRWNRGLERYIRPSVINTLDVGLIAYWPFDETAGTNVPNLKDNANNGTLQNMDDTDWVPGQIGNATEYDGTDEHMTYPKALINRDVGSIAHWVFPSGLRQMALLYESDGTASVDYNGFRAVGVDALEIHTGMNTNDQFQFNYQRGGDGSMQFKALNSITLLINLVWTHCLVTWDTAGFMKIYINGVLDASLDISTNSFQTKTTTVRNLGRVGDGTSSRHWRGRIDETRVYDRVLIADEAAALASLGV